MIMTDFTVVLQKATHHGKVLLLQLKTKFKN